MLDNKYRKFYEQLINFRKLTPPTGYCEKHHIIPKSLGGSDDKKNLVKLTAREHYIAHACLIRFTEGEDKMKMCFAFHMMHLKSGLHERYINSRLYESNRKLHSEYKKLIQSPEKREKFSRQMRVLNQDPEYKKKLSAAQKAGWTPEVKRQHSIRVKERYKNDNSREKISQTLKDLWQTDEYRAKMSKNKKRAWTDEKRKEHGEKIRAARSK